VFFALVVGMIGFRAAPQHKKVVGHALAFLHQELVLAELFGGEV
jgi:hypothetical protein